MELIDFAFDRFDADGGPTATVKRMGALGGVLFRRFVRSRFAQPPPEAEFEALLDYLVGINCDLPPGTESALFATFGHYLVTKAELPTAFLRAKATMMNINCLRQICS